MTDKDLARRLALLADEMPAFKDAKRVLSGTDRFATIIAAIDETVIPAILYLSDGKAEITLDVAGRRLVRLPGQIEALTADDEVAVARAATAIAAFADGSDTEILLRETASDQKDVDPTQSVSIADICAAAGRPLIDLSAPPLVQLRQALDAMLAASVVIEKGKIARNDGDVDLATALSQDWTAHLQKNLPSAEKGLTLTTFATNAGSTGTRGVIQDGNDALVFALNRAGYDRLMDVFRTASAAAV